MVLRSGQTLWSSRNVAKRGKKVWNICRAWKFSSRTSLRAWFLGHGGGKIWVNYRDLSQGHPTSTNNVFFYRKSRPKDSGLGIMKKCPDLMVPGWLDFFTKIGSVQPWLSRGGRDGYAGMVGGKRRQDAFHL